MQLFDNFDHQPPNYIPNNMFPRIPEKMVSLDTDTMHPLFRKGEMVGYWWNYGDSVSLEINNKIHIGLPAGAITTYEKGVYPTPDTVGDFPYQKFYNLADLKSFTLDAIVPLDDTDEVLYVWVEDFEFTYLQPGQCEEDVWIELGEGQEIYVELLNFRYELLKDWVFGDESNMLTLTPDESSEYKPGMYILRISLVTTNDEGTLLDRKLTNQYELNVR